MRTGGGQDGYGAFRTPTSTLRYPIPWGCTETPDPNLGDALGLQTYTLGVHLDPKPKSWGALETPDSNFGGARRPQTQTLGVPSDPKPEPWGCPQTPNPHHNASQHPKVGTQGTWGSRWGGMPHPLGVLGGLPMPLGGGGVIGALHWAAVMKKDFCLGSVNREFGVNKKNRSCPAWRLPALS